jgi:hypothetical protein
MRHFSDEIIGKTRLALSNYAENPATVVARKSAEPREPAKSRADVWKSGALFSPGMGLFPVLHANFSLRHMQFSILHVPFSKKHALFPKGTRPFSLKGYLDDHGDHNRAERGHRIGAFTLI